MRITARSAANRESQPGPVPVRVLIVEDEQTFPIRDALRHELNWTHCRIPRQLGEGGMGSVWLAEGLKHGE